MLYGYSYYTILALSVPIKFFTVRDWQSYLALLELKFWKKAPKIVGRSDVQKYGLCPDLRTELNRGLVTQQTVSPFIVLPSVHINSDTAATTKRKWHTNKETQNITKQRDTYTKKH